MNYKSFFSISMKHSESETIHTLVCLIILFSSVIPHALLAQPYEGSRRQERIEPEIEWGDPDLENTENSPAVRRSENEHLEDEQHSLVHTVLLYIPNRIFDVLDIVRARVKVGPGFGAGLRVTDAGELYLGAHTSVFAGLPGPRQEPALPIPVGIESRGGIKLSVLDGTVGMGFDPDYSSSEVGTSLHLGLVGADLMVDPVEFADLLAGIFLIDVRDDDL